MTKLAPKRYGPFKIIKEISPVAYWLQLPLTWMIHDVFHASLLSPYSETPTYGPSVTAYFDLSSYLYLSRLIHDASLIIYELSVPPARLQHVYVCTRTRVNAYRTYPLSRYLAVNYLTSQRVFSHSTYLFRTHIPTLT